MNVILRYPLRHLIMGILAGFAIVIGLLTYVTTRPVVLQYVEQRAADRLRVELTQMQGVLQLLLRSENVEGARSVVASLGSAPEHKLALMVDAAGIIQASTRLADVGAAWTSLGLPLDTHLIEQVAASGGAVVRLDPDGQRLTGYVNICEAVAAETLRPPTCGFLYRRLNLSGAKAAAVAALHRQAVGYGFGLVAVAGVLGMIFHRVVTRRVERLIATVNRFTTGDMTVRASLKGQDELAHVGDAFDSMAQTIANHHQQLQELNTELAQRLIAGKQAEEALSQAHDELEQRVRDRTVALEMANEEVRRFAYIVSHDLRAPLINLKGFARELRDLCELLNTTLPQLLPHLDEPQRTEVARALIEDGPEALGFIETSVTRMDGLIRAVLNLSRAGQREMYIEPVDTNALAQDIAQTLRYQLTQHDAHITIEPLPNVHVDRTAMEQIFDNLLGNAVKYLDPDRPGEITVRADCEADTTTFYVCDNGRGIAEDDLPKVFELFRRVGWQDTPGEGMGLAYVQALVRRHGGEITCQSTLGVGSTFTFTIAHHLCPNDPDADS